MKIMRVAILLFLFIFAMIIRAWGDPDKLIKNTANPLMTMKMDGNKAPMQKKSKPAKEPVEVLEKSRPPLRKVDFLRTVLEEKKRSQWLDSLDRLIYVGEFSANAPRNDFFSPPQVKEVKSSSPNVGPSRLRPYPDGNGFFEEGQMSKTLKLLQSKEEAFKEVFLGFRFPLELTHGYLLLEMNVAPSPERSSGLMIRF